MEIVLVRHGETEWSRDHRHTGRTDVPLTAEGRRQAERLRDALAEWSFTRVLSSPLSRALDTCRLAGYGERAELSDALLEWDYGEYEGETTDRIRESRPGWNLWRDGCPGGETVEQVGERADRAIARALETQGEVAIVAHGHLLRILGARWIGLPASGGGALALDTATRCELGFERERRVIVTWNLR
jgi:broad specificity phosphatase PhoE